MLFMFSREMSTWFLGGVIDNARNTKRTPPTPPYPPLAGNAFPHPPRLSLSLLSSIPFVFLPLFSIYSSFLTPSFFFLISYRIKAIKTLCICTYLFVFSKPKNSTSKGVGRKGVLVRGRFFIFYFF